MSSKPIKRGGKPKYGRSNGSGYSSKRPVGGPGLFITCVRGKEQRCVAEVLDMLDIYANKLYSPERLAAYAALPPTWMLKESNLSTKDPLNLDSLADTLPSDPQQRPEDPLSSDSEEEDPVDESIEDSIARELLALKAARSAGRRNINESGQRDGDAVDSQGTKQVREKRIRPRFMSLETNCECLVFIAFEKPYDPLEITLAIVADLKETGVSHTRYTNRLSPVQETCHSLSLDEVDIMALRLMKQVIPAWLSSNNTTSFTYSIDPTIRCHVLPHHRASVVLALATSLRSLDSPVQASSANLTQPDLVILPTIFKNCYGISILEGKLWLGQGKKFNLDSIGMEARREKSEREGATSVRGVVARKGFGQAEKVDNVGMELVDTVEEGERIA